MENINPAVSVVVITYGHEKYIRQAIDSILMQQVDFEYEIIIGEDKSPDNTRSILLEYREKYPDKIKLILREENIGTVKNLHDVYMHCSGEYIAYLEGDDYWTDPHKLQIQYNFLENHRNEYIAVSHVFDEISEGGNITSSHPIKRFRGTDITIHDFLKGFTFPLTATFFKNIFKNDGHSFDFIFNINRYVLDLSMCFVLLDMGKIHIIDRHMSIYRTGRRSDSTEKNYNTIRKYYEIYADHIAILKALEAYYNKKYSFDVLYVKYFIYLSFSCIRAKDIKCIFQAFTEMPLKRKLLYIRMLPGYSCKRIINKLKWLILK